MDGVFSELNPDVLTVEVDDFTKDVYKLMKVFISRYKKAQVQRDERERERKKSFRRRSTIVDPQDPSMAPLRKVEAEAQPAASIVVCEKVIAQLNEFRVGVYYYYTTLPLLSLLLL